jgi:hypothetical protein
LVLLALLGAVGMAAAGAPTPLKVEPPPLPPGVPATPFGARADLCPVADGAPYAVSGFPGTPYIITPFTDKFRNPVDAVYKNKVCR